jgi:hypothetical protein
MAVLTYQSGESWPHRILSWIYPAREWAGVQPVDEPEPGVKRANKTGPTQRKPVSLRAGEAK